MNDTTNPLKALRRQWLTPGFWRGDMLGLILLVALILILALLGEAARVGLRYERVAILMDHEYWRLFTGHLVHGSWQHTLLNLAGLALIPALFRHTYQPGQWCWIALISTVAIDVGVLWLMPQLQWYVGLSGVLHGLLAAGAVAWWRFETRFMALLLSALLIGKLGWEQWQGALPLSGDLNVIVNAHLYGAIGGALAGLLLKTLPTKPAISSL